ncbi:hypothetical protein AX14_005989 [Amanita brunnescens Koide BX004]|nr:hypothetical protein AX14_005989 [Amanita brunnescens Koide BX004]
MDEARKDPESVIEKPKAPVMYWLEWYWDLTRRKLPVRSYLERSDYESDDRLGGGGRKSGFENVEDRDDKWGTILPQVGTVTRLTVEKTRLTAAKAKENRVGSEVKPMVPAPPDWIRKSCETRAGRRAILYARCDGIKVMTLEGSKSAGTDLDSKNGKDNSLSRDKLKC